MNILWDRQSIVLNYLYSNSKSSVPSLLEQKNYWNGKLTVKVYKILYPLYCLGNFFVPKLTHGTCQGFSLANCGLLQYLLLIVSTCTFFVVPHSAEIT